MKKESIDKRFRYPTKFNTKREMLWYIRGLMDAKQTIQESLDIDISKYRDLIHFTKFKDMCKSKKGGK